MDLLAEGRMGGLDEGSVGTGGGGGAMASGGKGTSAAVEVERATGRAGPARRSLALA